MKKIIATFFAVAMLATTPTLAQDLQKGMEAYEKKDYATAHKVWKPLAEQGNPHAQYNLGVLYDEGNGVPQDYAEAIKWYLKAAEQGDAGMQFTLGMSYSDNSRTTLNYVQAAKWLRKAAVQGHAEAQRALGYLYISGSGVPRDIIAAHVWINIAAGNGDELARAQRSSHRLSSLVGKLTPADLAKAQTLARKCFESNYRDCP